MASPKSNPSHLNFTHVLDSGPSLSFLFDYNLVKDEWEYVYCHGKVDRIMKGSAVELP